MTYDIWCLSWPTSENFELFMYKQPKMKTINNQHVIYLLPSQCKWLLHSWDTDKMCKVPKRQRKNQNWLRVGNAWKWWRWAEDDGEGKWCSPKRWGWLTNGTMSRWPVSSEVQLLVGSEWGDGTFWEVTWRWWDWELKVRHTTLYLRGNTLK